MLTTVEKVIFLQDVDIFESTSTENLGHIAAITDEVEMASGTMIFTQGEFPDSMYLVLEGRVRMTRDGQEIMVAQTKDVFGTWALFDDEPRVATAVTVEDTRLLRIGKDDFIDVLGDHVEITQSVLKTNSKAKSQKLQTN